MRLYGAIDFMMFIWLLRDVAIEKIELNFYKKCLKDTRAWKKEIFVNNPKYVVAKLK